MIYGKMPVLFLGVASSEKHGSINSAIAGYILEHQDQVRGMGIQQLAEACHVSPASISRFCKEIGFDSYGDLQEVLSTTRLTYETPSEKMTAQERVTETVGCIAESVQAVGKGIDLRKVRHLCRELHQYEKVAAFGLLKAETAAVSLQCDLLMQGKKIYTHVSFPQQMDYILHAGSEDLILLFSCTGSYFEYQDLRGADLRAPRIWMIAGEEKAWPSYVDETLLYPAHDGQICHPYQLLTVASLIAEEYGRIS